MKTAVSQIPRFRTITEDQRTGPLAVPASPSESFALERSAVRSCRLEAGETVEILILKGSAWVTMEGDPEDYVLTAGESKVFQGPGLLVSEGLLDCTGVEFRI